MELVLRQILQVLFLLFLSIVSNSQKCLHIIDLLYYHVSWRWQQGDFKTSWRAFCSAFPCSRHVILRSSDNRSVCWFRPDPDRRFLFFYFFPLFCILHISVCFLGKAKSKYCSFVPMQTWTVSCLWLILLRTKVSCSTDFIIPQVFWQFLGPLKWFVA